MGRTKELFKNASFVSIGNIGSKLIGFLMLPLYTKWLSPGDYGITDIISTYSMLLLNVVACDISDSIVVFPVGQSFKKIRKYYSTGFVFQILCSILCAIVFYLLSLFDVSNSFFQYIWLIYGILISSLFQKYVQDFCRGIKRMSVFSFTGIVQSLSIAVLSFVLVSPLGIIGFVIATIASNIITALFTFFYSRSINYLRITSFDIGCLKEMVSYSIPLIPTAIMWWLVSSLNRPMIESYWGFYFIGLFTVANKLPSIINMVFGFFQQAWIVTVIEEAKKPDFESYYNKMFRIIFTTQVFLCMIVGVFSKFVINLLTTPDYDPAWVYIPMLSLSVLFSNTSAFCGTIFSANKLSKYIFYSVIVGGIVAVVANYLLIPRYGLWGACFAMCLAHGASAFSRIIMSSKFVRFKNGISVLIHLVIFSVLYIGILSSSLVWKVVLYTLSFCFFFFYNKDLLIDAYSYVRQWVNRSNNKLSIK